MGDRTIHRILTYLIAAVSLINGLFCKVLNLVPRHRQIVAEILGEDHGPRPNTYTSNRLTMSFS